MESFAKASLSEIYEIVKPCGLGNKKAADIINICKQLSENFKSAVPCSFNNLLSLPGVGRKTANLVRAVLFSKPAIIVDTHVLRISNRLGIVKSKNPKKIEQMLLKQIEPSQTESFCHQLVQFGRLICTAKKPKCLNCFLTEYCSYYSEHKLIR